MSDFLAPEYLENITDFSLLKTGDIIRRNGNGKDQQGVFVRQEDATTLLVADVIDLNGPSFIAEGGRLRVGDGERLYRYRSTFLNSSNADTARKIVQAWTLFREYPELQTKIAGFIESVYSPEQIVDLKNLENLRVLFVPTQEYFKIGKFKEKTDWNRVRDDLFRSALEALADGKHLTYIAFIPTDGSHKPLFFTIGTKPHIETLKVLGRQPYYFKPTHGGHLKIVSGRDEPKKRFVVDAGSNDLGVGVRTSLATAQMITDALGQLFPEYEFTPLPGRDAYGVQQSY